MPRSHLDPLLPQNVILNALIRDTTAGLVALTVINIYYVYVVVVINVQLI